MIRTWVWFGSLLCLGYLLSGGAIEEPSFARGQKQAAKLRAQAERQKGDQETVRLATALVTLSVGVFDKKGQPVSHLTQDEFQVYEDDQRHPVAFFGVEDLPMGFRLAGRRAVLDNLLVRTNNDGSKILVLFDCLPEGIKPSDIVSYRPKGAGPDEHITVANKLSELKARCKRGELVDGKGKRIKFFKMACYGNPPSDYEEIRQKESEELEKLQKNYTVIVMECDPRIS